MRILFLILFLDFEILSFAEVPLDEPETIAMRETLRQYIKDNAVIADICVYQLEWIPALPNKKGELIERAVVTHVHCGALRVGNRIEYVYYVEDTRFSPSTLTVEGKLRTFFYDPDGSEKVVNEILMIEGDGHWGFSRVGDRFADLFELELRTNPKLKSVVAEPGN